MSYQRGRTCEFSTHDGGKSWQMFEHKHSGPHSLIQPRDRIDVTKWIGVTMRSVKFLMLLCGILVMTLGMVACGGDDDDPSSTASSTRGAAVSTASDAGGGDGDEDDPCSLLTPAEIEAAVGLPAGEGSLNDDESGVCSWLVGPADAFKAVHLGVESVELYNTVRPRDGVIDVADIGDEAYWVSGLSTLWVRQGETVISMQVVTLQPDDEIRVAAVAMARAALDRL